MNYIIRYEAINLPTIIKEYIVFFMKNIKKLVSENDIVLFMKGSADFPMCGFSAAVVDILDRHGVHFVDVNVLEDEQLRQDIKVFSDWPTIPQLYVKGEFVGGCDIITEMENSGELAEVLQAKA